MELTFVFAPSLGSTVAYTLGGAALTARGGGFPLFPWRQTVVSALPTPSFYTFRDAAAFASGGPYHAVTLPPGAATPGRWIAAVANARPTSPPAFLLRDAAAGWGGGRGLAGGAAPMHFTLRVALGAAPEALCPLGCVHGSCIAGACVCDAPAANATNATDASAAPPAAWAGPGCDVPITPLAAGYDVDGAVAESSFAHYWLPLDAATQSNADLTIELAYDQNPAVRAPA